MWGWIYSHLYHEPATLSFVGQQLPVGAALADLTVKDDEYLVHVSQVGQAVSHEDTGLALQKAFGSDYLLKDVLANVSIHCWQPDGKK